MSNSLNEELLLEPKSSTGLKIVAAIAAVAVAAILLAGYFYLRQRHAEETLGSNQVADSEPRKPPKAIILVDDPTVGGGKTTLAGTVRNTSNETLTGLQVDLELKSRKGAGTENRLVKLEPSDLQPGQEGRYSLQLQAQDYASARLVALRSGDLASVPYTTGPGQKRQPERLESKTITVDKKPPGKRDEFLNSPDDPARVP